MSDHCQEKCIKKAENKITKQGNSTPKNNYCDITINKIVVIEWLVVQLVLRN